MLTLASVFNSITLQSLANFVMVRLIKDETELRPLKSGISDQATSRYFGLYRVGQTTELGNDFPRFLECGSWGFWCIFRYYLSGWCCERSAMPARLKWSGHFSRMHLDLDFEVCLALMWSLCQRYDTDYLYGTCQRQGKFQKPFLKASQTRLMRLRWTTSVIY